MADRVTESVDNKENDKGNSSLQNEELSTFVEGRESTPDAPTSAAVRTPQVLEHPYIHASSHPESLQSSTPSSTAPAPSFSVQFTPNPSTVHSRDEDCRGEEIAPAADQSHQQLRTPERENERSNRETETLCHGDTSGNVSGAEHSASNPSLSDGVMSRTLDSAIHSSPIATPAPSSSLTTERQSLSKELGMSPYVFVKDGLVEVSQYESPGLLYARSMKESHNLDILRPADEVHIHCCN